MKILVVLGSILVVAVLGLFLVAPPIVKHFAFKNLSPEEAAGYETWKNKKLTIPAEALKVAPFSPATESAAKAFREAWQKDKTRAEDTASHYFSQSSFRSKGKIDFAKANRDLSELAPLIQAFETLISQPDYEMSAQATGAVWGPSQPDPIAGSAGAPVPDFLSSQICAKLLRLKALAQADAGQMEQALDTAARIVRSARSSPYDTLISQLIGIAASAMGVRTWEDVVASCKDPKLLRATLAMQDKLAKEQICLTSDLPITVVDQLGVIREYNSSLRLPRNVAVVDQLGLIREYNRRGGKVEVQGLTARQIGALKLAIDSRSGPSRNGGRIMAWWLGSFWSNPVLPILYAIATPNFLEARTRAEVVRSTFDLLRLGTARRIWALEHGGARPSRMADLVPALLPELPTDRFAQTKTPYGEGAAWHSIGPDGIDQKGALLYDPTNGTKSAGDVVLAR